jgi:hypothetical protein
MSDTPGASEDSTVFERAVIAIDAGRVSGIKEAILRATPMGEEIFLCDGRSGDGRDDKGIYKESI